MKIRQYALAGVLLGAVATGPAWAQQSAPQLHQPHSIRQTAFEYDSYLNFTQDAPSASPSDAPAPAAPATPAPVQEQAPAVADAPAPVAAPVEYSCDPACLSQSSCYKKSSCKKPLFDVGGWVEGGYTWNPDDPADRYNGPVTFNDRSNEPMMNQFYLFMERATDTSDRGWDWGFRADAVYGTDARFIQAAGLETEWNQTERFYQVALPQFYGDIAVGDWLFRFGHFYTIIGYEVCTAPDNFFYSHAYTFQYAEPFTHTGALAKWQMTDRFSMTAGLHTGGDQFGFEDDKDAVNFLGGVNWTGPEERLNVAFAINAQDNGPNSDLTVYSIVASLALTDNLNYIVQHDYGQAYDNATGDKADWYGLNQYVLYTINEAWSAGLRAEWFRDEDGARVTGLGDGNTIAGAAFPGDFFEFTAGLNWKPFERLVIRPEVRYDWYDRSAPTALLPYDDGTSDNQFLVGCDAIVTF